MPSENPPFTEPKKQLLLWPDVDPALQKWRAQERIFWMRHHELLAMKGVLGLRACPDHQALVNILIDKQEDVKSVRDLINSWMEKIGLSDDQYRVVEQPRAEAAIASRPYVPHKYPEKAPPSAT